MSHDRSSLSPPEAGRRRLLGALALSPLATPLLLAGCTTTPPLSPVMPTETTQPAAAALLAESAAAHGLGAWRRVRDLSLSCRGEWRTLIDRLQPELVDARFRIASEERLLPTEGLIAQVHTGPGGHKHVLRRQGSGERDTGSVEVTYNGLATRDATLLQASALAADSSRLGLLGPLALVDGAHTLRLAGLEQVGEHACERLMVRLNPGLGLSPVDQLVLCIDRRTRLMRRVRFTLDGLASARGTLIELDTRDFQNIQGIEWPTRFHERMRRPVPHLPVRDWQLTGLDINRGLKAEELGGGRLSGAARGAARALPGAASAT
ncbi:MAG: hypothetical protein RL654_2922 [Pseudomonadota bacterium]|jgi:hypothetical protein